MKRVIIRTKRKSKEKSGIRPNWLELSPGKEASAWLEEQALSNTLRGFDPLDGHLATIDPEFGREEAKGDLERWQYPFPGKTMLGNQLFKDSQAAKTLSISEPCLTG
ncbi:hypothetical protein VNO77_02044 [Canavalia gladiata]|uniref:Uncharacterized protein n=1 Tax=Canavalia gladiata TaxID=3824 RepID=A0AAN9MUA0_CANGL